jgi:hypothetical protein
MNTHRLGQLYDQLTPRERLPLIMAAHLRGDAADQKRLSASAPLKTLRVPNYYPLAKALRTAVHWQMQTLLDLAGHFWQWWGVWMSYGLYQARDDNRMRGRGRRAGAGAKKRRGADAELFEEYRAHGITRYYASRFVAHVDGWKQFCAEIHADPEAQLKLMIGWNMVTQTENAARSYVFSEEEAARFERLETVSVAGDATKERGPVPVESAADLARGWHVLLDELVRHEGGE